MALVRVSGAGLKEHQERKMLPSEVEALKKKNKALEKTMNTLKEENIELKSIVDVLIGGSEDE